MKAPTRTRRSEGAIRAELVDADALRAEFVRLMTVDSSHHDRRRRDYNQAIFNADEGWAIWTGTTIDMVLDKFDAAVTKLKR